MRPGEQPGERAVLIRLVNEESLGRELRTYKKTENYLKTRTTAPCPRRRSASCGMPPRRTASAASGSPRSLKRLVVEADYFVTGQPLTIKSQAPSDAIDKALEYLVANTFTKMGYIKVRNPSPEKEIQAILRSNDIGQQTLSSRSRRATPRRSTKCATTSTYAPRRTSRSSSTT